MLWGLGFMSSENILSHLCITEGIFTGVYVLAKEIDWEGVGEEAKGNWKRMIVGMLFCINIC